MRKTFPKYDKGSLKTIELSFKKKDKEMIKKYLIFCGGTGGRTTVAKYHSVLIKIVDVMGGDMDKIDLDRLREFLEVLNNSDLLPTTKNEIKKLLKRFLKEFYEDWNTRFKQLADIKGESEINQDRINADTILKPKEIEQLMRGCNNLMYKSAIMCFYETAARPEELLKIQFRDLNLEDGSIKLKSSKTGNIRVNPIQNSIVHLKQWKEQYPFDNVSPDDYVYVNYKKRGTHITRVAAGLFLKRLGKKVLDKDIFMYLIRHTRLTELQKVLPAKIYEKFADHSIETATRYSHLDKDDVREAMFKNVYEVEEISKDDKHKLRKEMEDMQQQILNLQRNYVFKKRKTPLTKEQALKELSG